MSDLQKPLLRLDDAGIDSVLVGGYAAMLHGSSLLTRDLDVCATLTPDAIGKLQAAFRDFNPRHRLAAPQASFLDDPETGVSLTKLTLNTDLGTLDLLGRITGIGDFARGKVNLTPFFPLDDDDQRTVVLRLVAERRVGRRPGRIEPRAIKRRPKSYPLLTQPRAIARQTVREHGHP